MQPSKRTPMKRALGVGAAVLALSLPSPALAGVIVAAEPGSSVQSMPATNTFTAGPVAFGDGVTWSSTTSNSVFGWTGSYGFDSNGFWSGNPPMAGLNADNGTMTFLLSGDVGSVGGLLNWACCSYSPAIMSVFDSNNILLETFALSSGASNLATPDSFYGFSRSQNDIRSFALSGGFIGLRDLTVGSSQTAAVPEPSAWAMMLIGFGFVGGAMRARRRQKLTASYA